MTGATSEAPHFELSVLCLYRRSGRAASRLGHLPPPAALFSVERDTKRCLLSTGYPGWPQRGGESVIRQTISHKQMLAPSLLPLRLSGSQLPPLKVKGRLCCLQRFDH